MKRLIAVALVGTVLGVVFFGPSSASANCRTVGCFNTQINKLKRQVRTLTQQVAGLQQRVYSCENTLVPVTEYGGYAYNLVDPFETTALDVTDPGDSVDAWLVANSCQGASTAKHATAWFGPPQSR